MSVNVGDRGASQMQFIATADEIEVFTIRRCANYPQQYRSYILEETAQLASRASDLVGEGNKIYPVKPGEKPTRKKGQTQEQYEKDMLNYRQKVLRFQEDVLRRETKWREAIETYYALNRKITKMRKIRRPGKRHKNQYRRWAKLISDEINLLKGLLESDKQRFKF